MREELGDLANELDDVELAWAVLAVGLIPPAVLKQKDLSASELLAVLKRRGAVHAWHPDAFPLQRATWLASTSLARLAEFAEKNSEDRLRVKMPGRITPLTLKVWEYLVGQLGRHLALHFGCGTPKRKLRFGWPARVAALPDNGLDGQLATLAERDSWNGNVYAVHRLSRRRPECDVLLYRFSLLSEAFEALSASAEALGGVRADLVLAFCVPPAPLTPDYVGLLNRIRARVGAGGIALVSGGDIAEAARAVLIEISHGDTVDVAIANTLASDALLLASPQLIAAAHLKEKVRKLISVLTHETHASRPINTGTFGRWGDADLSLLGPPSIFRARGAPGPPPPGPHERVPTRGQIGEQIRRHLESYQWSHEGDEASDLGRALKSLQADDEVRAKPRYLQVRIGTADAPDRMTQTLFVRTTYQIGVRIGEKAPDYLIANEPFPDLPPPDDGRANDLRVVFWEPTLCPQPQLGNIELPPAGASSVCYFQLRTGPEISTLDARITVLHRNRVLQTGRLRAPIGSEGAATFTLDACPRQMLSGLDERLNFSMALVLNDAAHRSAIHSHTPGQSAVIYLDNDDVGQLIGVIGRAISNITTRPQDFQGLRAPGSVDLLRLLAQKGASLRQYLEKHGIAGGKLQTPDHVQLVATRPGKVFPLEFLYDYEAPEPDATICPGAETALCDPFGVLAQHATNCPASCPDHRDKPGVMAHTICPMAFWGLRCAIERPAHTAADNKRPGNFTLISEPTDSARRVLRPLHATVVGGSAKANLVVPTAMSDMMTRIAAVVPASALVTDWASWVQAIDRLHPTLLTLVAHQETDQYGTPLLDIGAAPYLSADLVKNKYVCAGTEPPPIVLLVGCETGQASISYENFALRFRDMGAALVVSTIAEVLGRQAAPAAAELVESMKAVTTPTSFAEVLRDVRRRLLANGTPMVLALTALGDADWEIVAM